jgi:hypothetical protein
VRRLILDGDSRLDFSRQNAFGCVLFFVPLATSVPSLYETFQITGFYIYIYNGVFFFFFFLCNLVNIIGSIFFYKILLTFITCPYPPI